MDENTVLVLNDETMIEKDMHVVINADRSVAVPSTLQRSIVQRDHNIQDIIFDCPRYWYEHDLYELRIYVNYVSKNPQALIKKPQRALCTNVEIDADDPTMLHFTWTITNNASKEEGVLAFLICALSTDEDGNEDRHWNSHICKDLIVQEGMEATDWVVLKYPDILEQILVKIDAIEVPTKLSQLEGDATHRTVTDAEKQKWNKVDELASDLVNELPNNETLINNVAEKVPAGKDGVSPTVTLEETDSGVIVEAYNPTGTQQIAFIPRGEKGEQGVQGIQGIQGVQGIQGIQGEKGEKGDTGESGVNVPTNGLFSLKVNELGELIAVYNDDDAPPQFRYDEETGEVYYIVYNHEILIGSVKGVQGEKGDQGIQGVQGEKGDNGYTPVKGTDYWTSADKAEMMNDIKREYPKSENGNRWGVIPEISTDGVIEIGKYLDFHNTDGSTDDYNLRITANEDNVDFSLPFNSISVPLSTYNMSTTGSTDYTCTYIPSLKMCFFRGYLTIGVKFSANSDSSMWQLPAAYKPRNGQETVLQGYSGTVQPIVKLKQNGTTGNYRIYCNSPSELAAGSTIYVTGFWFV